MKLGITLPQGEMPTDPTEIRAFAQAAEECGFDHVVIADHVLGADQAHYPSLPSSHYSRDASMHEPFVLMGYLAAHTTRLELVTSILILSQRQTVLVAKQAAEVDVLSGGRLRLGIGLGGNHVEFEALNENLHDRGRRSEEQIALMRALWTQPVVYFQGRWHHVSHAGINPMPVQRPIPLWIGGGRGAKPGNRAEAVIQRIAHFADGWMTQFLPSDAAAAALERLRSYARDINRDPSSIGIEGRIKTATPTEEWLAAFKWWQKWGATHVNVDTRRCGLRTLKEHLELARRFKDSVAV